MGPGFGEHRPPFEQAMGPGGNHGKWWNNPKVVETLKLTDEQRKAMDGILLDHREKLIDLHANVQKAELGLEPLIGVDQPNESAILAQIDKIAQARAELEKGNARFLLALRGKLTPEQWKTLQAERANRENRGGWQQRDKGPRGPGQRGQGPDGQRPGGQYHRQPPPPPAGAPAPGPQGDSEGGAPPAAGAVQ
jgi:Spy/CpxP family protein refolding chaperone